MKGEPALRSPESGLLLRLLRENLAGQRWIYALAIAAMCVTAATTALTAWLIQPMIDAMTSGETGRVLAVAGGVLAVFFLKGAAGYIQIVALTRAGSRIVARQQHQLFEKLLGQGVAFFNVTQSSSVLLRFTQSARAARTVVELVVTSFVRDLLTLLGLVAVMVYQQPVLSAVTLLFGPFALIAVRLMLRRVTAIVGDETRSLGEITKVIQETARGIHVVKVFGLERRMLDRLRRAVRLSEGRTNAIARVQAATVPVADGLTGLAIAAVILVSAGTAPDGGEPEAGRLISFVAALLMAYEPAKRLMRVRVGIEAGMAKVRQMYALLDTTVQVTERPDAVPIPEGPIRIRMEGVRFGYRGGTRILHDLTLDIAPGRTTALVGPSGGGKSTVINLLMRLYDPDEGRIEFNGVDLRGISLESLRARTSFVSQDAFLFSGTVRENLLLGRTDVSEDELVEAARAAEAHDFITRLPGGYDADIGETGGALSGGQQQRLAIARAMLRRSDLLILDEPTSALDAETERRVVGALRRLRASRTTIVVAHKLSTVLESDFVCFLQGGRVIETGTPAELFKKGGAFARLFSPDHRPPGAA